MKNKSAVFILASIFLVSLLIVSLYPSIRNTPTLTSPIADTSMAVGCFETLGEKVILNFSVCQPCTDVKYVGFGSTHVRLTGLVDSMCQMTWGGEVENPNWDGSLINNCSIPATLGKSEFAVTNYGVDFSSINQYCDQAN